MKALDQQGPPVDYDLAELMAWEAWWVSLARWEKQAWWARHVALRTIIRAGGDLRREVLEDTTTETKRMANFFGLQMEEKPEDE